MLDRYQEGVKSMQNYINAHSYLEEAAKLYQNIDNAVEFIEPIEFPNVDECKKLVAEGLPLLQHEDLQAKITEALQKHSPKVIETFQLNINETLERLIKWAIIERLIPRELKSSDTWEEWLKPYCPVCGRKPLLAQLRKQNEGRARYLKCGGCGTMWRWNRLGCTYCDNEDLYKMHILEVESEPEMRLDVCDKCHSYIKTYNHEGDENIYLNDWATLHFDLLAEEEGLQKVGSILIE